MGLNAKFRTRKHRWLNCRILGYHLNIRLLGCEFAKPVNDGYIYPD